MVRGLTSPVFAAFWPKIASHTKNISSTKRTNAENIFTQGLIFESVGRALTWSNKKFNSWHQIVLSLAMGDSSDEDDWGGPKAQIGLQELVLWSWHANATRPWRHVLTSLLKKTWAQLRPLCPARVCLKVGLGKTNSRISVLQHANRRICWSRAKPP